MTDWTKPTKSNPLYCAWYDMHRRCKNKNHKSFKNYGGRGITVCERWSDFQKFVEDMGEKPSSKHSIDRIDNDKGYSPDNCRWATAKEQMNNTRIKKSCYRGHPWTEENTIWTDNGRDKTRRCKTCYLNYAAGVLEPTSKQKAYKRGYADGAKAVMVEAEKLVEAANNMISATSDNGLERVEELQQALARWQAFKDGKE